MLQKVTEFLEENYLSSLFLLFGAFFKFYGTKAHLNIFDLRLPVF